MCILKYTQCVQLSLDEWYVGSRIGGKFYKTVCNQMTLPMDAIFCLSEDSELQWFCVNWSIVIAVQAMLAEEHRFQINILPELVTILLEDELWSLIDLLSSSLVYEFLFGSKHWHELVIRIIWFDMYHTICDALAILLEPNTYYVKLSTLA